ncbi:hypothetical protein Y032_0010g980 [Ancylostoma ceylanicum]|uniref:Uncharacterized protein n=1 Tax=Ancylostoma ceylanicum TaxID=53326 RepID=A0A016VGR1_9BILA|nr:hypothetical protein Y032_0010g980 [Ancylostoma ceylanicum]
MADEDTINTTFLSGRLEASNEVMNTMVHLRAEHPSIGLLFRRIYVFIDSCSTSSARNQSRSRPPKLKPLLPMLFFYLILCVTIGSRSFFSINSPAFHILTFHFGKGGAGASPRPLPSQSDGPPLGPAKSEGGRSLCVGVFHLWA